LPGSSLPAGFLPAGFLPAGFLPAGFLPELYSGAARDSLMAFAYNPDGTALTIDRNTWDLSENLYVRVTGPASDKPFSLSVRVVGGLCANIAAPTGDGIVNGSVPSRGLTSLLLWDSARFAAGDPAGNISALQTHLGAFAARGDINGELIDLSDAARYPRVAAARATALANPSCVAASNLLADEIKAVIDVYRDANGPQGQTTIQYLTLVGDDDVVPFYRYPDQSGLASENEYYPPVQELSAQNAALRENWVKGQDGYGSRASVWQGSYQRPVPDLAVGRLVGAATTVEAMLSAYEGVNGLVTPDTALVTGYDFVADAAQSVAEDLAATGVATTTLIQPVGEAPTGPNTWSVDDLRGRLLDAGTRDDLVLLTGHFDAGSALAADYEGALLATEILTAPAVLSNTIVLGLGCHSGYNVPRGAAIPLFSPDPDFAEAFNARGATYFASTGFAYGDTELVEYGERLLTNMASALTGSDEITVGQAAVRAKLDYLSQKTSLSGIDEKTLLQFVLYGLPMLRVNMPNTPVANSPASAVASVAAVPTQAGLSQQTIMVSANPTRTDVRLNGGVVTASYYTGGAGNITNPAEPIFPLESKDVSVPGMVLRGALVVSATYSDTAPITPLTSAPTTEQSRAHPAFFSDVFYPTQNVGANFVQAIDGGATRLLVVPAQYRSAGPGSVSGTMRVYRDIQVKLFYLSEASWDSNTGGIRDKALAAAPEIVEVASERLPGGDVAFRASIVDDANVGIDEVTVTYTRPGSGRWQSFSLARDGDDPTLWTATRPRADLPASETDSVYYVQAVNRVGRVT
ncbi:MAG: hypothetical protein HGA45_41325, partial [Chloroflexales bacterium]|nr:hypothetical protein [Chloroflexales bacterium]